MGFGSYDESEQENQEIETGEIEEDRVNNSGTDGEIEFEFGDTETDELVDQLQDMRTE